MRIISWITLAIFISLTTIGCSRILDNLAQRNMYPAPDNDSTKSIAVYPNEYGPVIFFLHGNGEDLKSLDDGFAQYVAKYGHVIIPEYPGYGPVEGVPSEKTIMAKVKKDFAEVKIAFPRRKIVIVGWSLGAAVAAQLADGEHDLVLISSWSSAKAAAKASPLGRLVDRVSDKFWADNAWETLNKAGYLKVNGLVIHGGKDTLIPVAQGIDVAKAMGATQIIVDEANHGDIFKYIWDDLDKFFKGEL